MSPRHNLQLLMIVGLLLFARETTAAPPERGNNTSPAFAANRLLARTVNFGNILEAPQEGEWGLRMEESFFPLVKEAGFTAIRLPIRWSAHAGKSAPYTIDSPFAERVDWAIEQALAQGLAIIINVHHYEELIEQPDRHEARFLALWRQIAERYRDQPERVLFELLNEPHQPMTPERLNTLYAKTLAVVRESNPERVVIVGPNQWNQIDLLPKLVLPDDERLIVTIHTYEPFKFTHQGASWAEGSEAWLGKTWGTAEDEAAVRKQMEKAAAWGREQGRPLFLGEFGVYGRAPIDSRVKWTRFVRSEAERLGMSWAYWEFAAGFGVYDPQKKTWREPLKGALLEQ